MREEEIKTSRVTSSSNLSGFLDVDGLIYILEDHLGTQNNYKDYGKSLGKWCCWAERII